MNPDQLKNIIYKIIEAVDKQVPTYANSEADWKNCQGNVALCIIDSNGNVYGKIWGDDKLRGRKYFDVAYRKAAQVWITGYSTGEFEKLVFTEQLNYKDFGIELPELMGWKGGQPIQLDKDTVISCGFSGFRGITDLAIVKNAVDLLIK